VANAENGSGGNTISVIDGRTCRVGDKSQCARVSPTVTVGNNPAQISVDESTETIYVTNVSDDTVSVIDGATCNSQVTSGCAEVPPTVRVGGSPLGIAVDPATHTAYVTNGNDNTVSMIDTARCNASHLSGCSALRPPTVAVGVGPTAVAVNDSTHTVYVADDDVTVDNDGTTVSVFDAATCNATVVSGCARMGTVTVGTGPVGVAVDPGGANTVYTANQTSNSVSVIDGRTCDAADLSGCAVETAGTVTVGQSPEWVGLDGLAHTLYVANSDDDTISVIDTNVCNGQRSSACAGLRAPTVQAGESPSAVAADVATHTLYAANGIDNDAANTTGCRHPAPTTTTGPFPAGLAVDQAVHTVYVPANGSSPGVVSMVNTMACRAGHTAGCAATSPVVKVGPNPEFVAVDGATHTVYVTNQGASPATMSVIDADTCNATHFTGCSGLRTLTFPAGYFATDLAVDSTTDTIYVLAGSFTSPHPALMVFNGATCDATTASGCGQTPETVKLFARANQVPSGVAVNEVTDTVYVTHTGSVSGAPGDTVLVFDGATCNGTVRTGCARAPATVTVGTDPTYLAVDEATDTIYVANGGFTEGPGTVSVINGVTCNGGDTVGCDQTTETISAGRAAFAVAVNAATDTVYVTNRNDSTVSVINGATCNASTSTGCDQIPPRVAVGTGPTIPVVDPAAGTVYETNIFNNTVSVLPTGR
jgi:DNA-binding beta-propeller fold protein YncE